MPTLTDRLHLRKFLLTLSAIAAALALVVVMLGAFTRLKEAGLGCPDWPGCYGQLTWPSTKAAIAQAQALYPDVAVSSEQAWPEMVHRYFAGTLGLMIFGLSGALLYYRKSLSISPWVPLGLISAVILQAVLGLWTVTWLLLPLVVMGHLLGGMTIFSLLVFSTLYWFGREKLQTHVTALPRCYFWSAIAGVAIVFCQIALGGWTGANYAALACIDFPTCHGAWIPQLDSKTAFDLSSPIGVNYQGGALNSIARITIQFFHRLGALITSAYLIGFIVMLWQSKQQLLRRLAMVLGSILLVQVSLGILNVLWSLPIIVAVAHNGGGAVLLGMMVFMSFMLTKREDNPHG